MAIQTFYSAHTAQTIDNGITLLKVTENFKEGLRLLRESPANHGNIGESAIDFSHSTILSNNGATGDYSVSFGYNTTSNNTYQLVLGKYNKGTSGTFFEIGIGVDDLDRKNALEVYESGLILAPELTTTLIGASDNKTLITKEYLKTIMPLDDYFVSEFIASDNQTDFIIFSKIINVVGVYLNGVRMRDTDYNLTNDGINTFITFTNPATAGDTVLIDYVESFRTIYDYTSGLDQTSFLIQNKIIIKAGVYTNGVKNNTSEYVFTNNGTDTLLTFNNPKAEDDWILIDYIESNKDSFNFNSITNQTIFTVDNKIFTKCGVFTDGLRNNTTEYSLTNNGTDTNIIFNNPKAENTWVLLDYIDEEVESEPLTLNDLSDVDTSGANNGYVLRYNGSTWVPDIDSPNNGQTPIGGIIMYDGLIADIPSNWALCDGTNGTVDLSDKFIYGTVNEASIGNTGGTATATMPAHTHTANHSHTANSDTTGAHSHGTGRVYGNAGSANGINWANNSDNYGELDTNSTGDHSHVITVDNENVTTSSAGTSGSEDNLPPYVKLAFIKRIS